MISENFKLAVLSPEVPDKDIKELFLALKVESEEDIKEAMDMLARHRPLVVEKVIAAYALRKALGATTKELLKEKTGNS